MLPETYQQLLDQPIVAVVAIPNDRGYPHQTPVWVIEYQGKVYFSTERDRAKTRHLQNTDKVGLSVIHPDSRPYFSAYCKATIREKDEFKEYEEVAKKLINQYVSDQTQQEQFLNNLMTNPARVLVELELQTIYPSK